MSECGPYSQMTLMTRTLILTKHISIYLDIHSSLHSKKHHRPTHLHTIVPCNFFHSSTTFLYLMNISYNTLFINSSMRHTFFHLCTHPSYFVYFCILFIKNNQITLFSSQLLALSEEVPPLWPCVSIGWVFYQDKAQKFL